MDTFLSAAQLDNLLAATIKWYERSPLVMQNLQDKPLLPIVMQNTGMFPGNPELSITWQTMFDYERGEHGFEGDQKLSFINPTGIKTARSYAKRRHLGIKVSHDEVQRNGVRISNTEEGMAATDMKKAAAVKLQDVLKTKVKSAKEGQARDRNEMFWGDGTHDRLDIPGIKYWIHDDPTVSMIVGGIDQGAVPGWRNRSALGIVANSGNSSEQVLVKKLTQEHRQLIRYGGGPTHALCGSDFLDQLQSELRARGSYTDSGWAKNGKSLDVSIGDATFDGMSFVYDPTLDDLGESKRLYWINFGEEGFQVLFENGEKEREHTPQREPDRLVAYKSWTTCFGTRMKRRQNSGVYSIA